MHEYAGLTVCSLGVAIVGISTQICIALKSELEYTYTVENSNRKSKIWNRFETSTQTKSRKFHRTVGSFEISSKSKFRVPCLSTHSYAPGFIVYPVRYRKQFDNFVPKYATLIFLEFVEKNHTFSEASNLLSLLIFWCFSNFTIKRCAIFCDFFKTLCGTSVKNACHLLTSSIF